ncbi:hypothetical protein [Phenylobacterium soli]|uniref:Lipoprotein n=1 Tax=Phenylobacterium soli TaxID=2170551 RepID=A0A328ALG3_9CAUL|nr:hypothetical protein [Phenylobacterium soli]RAK54254.1 hypothetical protein DJ017_06810 [Phenylobacterium soli]
MGRALLALATLMTLSACAEGYSYVYDYDPYLGPRGHYVRPFRPASLQGCARVAYVRQLDPWRGEYASGPVCAAAER